MIKTENDNFAEKSRMCFSVHTMELRMKLTYREWKSIKNDLFENKNISSGYITKVIPIEKVYKEVKEKRYRLLTAYNIGINYVDISKMKVDDITLYWLIVKLNPWRMLHPDEHPYLYIANLDEIHKCIDKVNDFFCGVGLEWLDVSMLYVSRIDYCVNISLGSREAVDEYMRLMKKGMYPYKSWRRTEYSESQKRNIATKNSFTVYTKRFEFSIYDKYRQMESEMDKYTEEEVCAADGTIRIELRVKRPLIYYDKKKFDVDGIEEFLNMAPQIGEERINKYLIKAYGKGKFVKMQEALSIINESRLKEKTKVELERILRITAYHNLQIAKMEYEKKMSTYMKKFNDLGISPITIEARSNYDSFEHPISYAYSNNANWASA